MVGAGPHLLFGTRVLLLRLLKRGLGFSWHGSFHQNGRQCSEVAQSRATSVPEKRGRPLFLSLFTRSQAPAWERAAPEALPLVSSRSTLHV